MTHDAPNPAVLDKVHVEASVDDLFATVTVEQRYANPTGRNIEAVYSFPLPLDGVLLSFEAEIGGKRLSGRVIEARAAEERYEEAITDGDSAILLEQAEPGLFTVSLGNLMPVETAVLRYRYGQLLRWNGDRVRLAVPTTMAPRYGSTSHMAPHQVPRHSLAAEHRFTFAAHIRGVLRGAELSCPTHKVRIDERMEAREVVLSGPGVMDRDVVLEARRQGAAANGTLVGRDRDGWIALASFRPEVPSDAPLEPSLIQIVVDCSGSMGGDSIAQARLAVERVLGALPEGALFNVILFGSRWRALFEAPARMDRETRMIAQDFARGIEADMGGTEIGGALRAAYGAARQEGRRDVLLITDGAVSDPRQLKKEGRASGHRVFTVGVGSAVGEAAVRGLAEATGGACELVTPRENMAERIERHFRRMWSPACAARLTWPAAPVREWPQTLDTVYDGDTLHAFAWFADRPEGRVRLELRLADRRVLTQEATVAAAAEGSEAIGLSASPLARIAAARRIGAGAPDAQELALAYQLITEDTKCIVVHERAETEKAPGLPETIKVPQTIAAGWHGMGRVDEAPRMAEFRYSHGPDFATSAKMEALAERTEECAPRMSMHRRYQRDDISHGLDALRRHLASWNGAQVPMIDELENWGLPDDLLDGIRALIREGYDETDVVRILLAIIAERGEAAPDRQLARLGKWLRKRSGLAGDPTLKQRVQALLNQGEPLWRDG